MNKKLQEATRWLDTLETKSEALVPKQRIYDKAKEGDSADTNDKRDVNSLLKLSRAPKAAST